MIGEWDYTEIPSGIDLQRPLMPQRKDVDDVPCGVDPAWLHEVLSVWGAICGSSPTREKMPERPTASWHNRLRGMAMGFGGAILKSVPSAAFANETDLAGLAALSDDDIPRLVSVGDEVKRTDVSGFYDWMKNAKTIPKHVTPHPLPALEYEESGWHIDNWTDDPSYHTPPAAPTIYRWKWEYSDYSGGDFEHLTGGYSVRHTARPFAYSAVVPGIKAAWIQSVSVFASVTGGVWDSAAGGATNSKRLYVPLSGVSYSQTGDGLAVSASVSPAAIKAALGISDPPYSASGTRSVAYTIGIYSGIVFLEIAADYRHP